MARIIKVIIAIELAIILGRVGHVDGWTHGRAVWVEVGSCFAGVNQYTDVGLRGYADCR